MSEELYCPRCGEPIKGAKPIDVDMTTYRVCYECGAGISVVSSKDHWDIRSYLKGR